MNNTIPSFGTTPFPTAVPNTSQVVIPQITVQQPTMPFQGFNQQPMAPQPMNYEQIGPQLNKVKGMDGAKQFPTVPNAVYALFDDSDTVMFLKVTDKNNYPVLLQRFRYTEEEEVVEPSPEYVTKQEYDSLLKEFNDLKEEIKNGNKHIQYDSANVGRHTVFGSGNESGSQSESR